MAYGIKYKFKFESSHGVTYTVNLLKDGFSGTATTRPLGKAPVIRMKDGEPFRATSCDLTLECQTDGEFAELYTSDPFEFRVDVFQGSTQIWTGFIATEIYAEPNIAPPYDVDVTATDGLGTLKEYDFGTVGTKSLRDMVRGLLQKTGLNLQMDWATSLHAASGTVVDFIDTVAINMDYMAEENCYDVLKTLLESIHATITQYGGRWLIIRETDLSVSSSGSVPVYRTPIRGSSSATSSTSITNARKSVGKMGVADMWPVGYTTRRVVPAKERITVEAPWNIVNAAYSVQDNEWVILDSGGSFVDVGDGNSYYSLAGSMYMARGLYRFTKSLAVTVRASGSFVAVRARWTPTGGTDYYWNGAEWGTDSSALTVGSQDLNVNTDYASEAAEAEFTIPAHGETTAGELRLYVGGTCKIFDVALRPIMNQGFRDTIIIDNGARGEGDTVSITGGRMTAEDATFSTPEPYGVWLTNAVGGNPVYLFTDNNFASKDFMSLQALGRAMSVALPRIETSGTLDFPSGMTLPPIAILANSVTSILTQYDWDLYNDELRFNAISLPAASMTVASETVTSLGNASVPSSSGGVSGGSSGGGGGGSTVSIADATSAGGEIVKLTIDGTTTSIKNGAAWGTTSNHKSPLTINGTSKTALLDGWTELPSVSSSDNGKVLQVSSGAWGAVTPPSVPTYYTGSSAPSSSLGSDGDIYLQTTT